MFQFRFKLFSNGLSFNLFLYPDFVFLTCMILVCLPYVIHFVLHPPFHVMFTASKLKERLIPFVLHLFFFCFTLSSSHVWICFNFSFISMVALNCGYCLLVYDKTIYTFSIMSTMWCLFCTCVENYVHDYFLQLWPSHCRIVTLICQIPYFMGFLLVFNARYLIYYYLPFCYMFEPSSFLHSIPTCLPILVDFHCSLVCSSNVAFLFIFYKKRLLHLLCFHLPIGFLIVSTFVFFFFCHCTIILYV